MFVLLFTEFIKS